MTPKEFTKTQKVRVIYGFDGMHIKEEDVYDLMLKYSNLAKSMFEEIHTKLIKDGFKMRCIECNAILDENEHKTGICEDCLCP